MITFNAEKREKAGKGAARACRREGRVPAVIYGGKQESVMISLHPVELEKALDTVGFYDADVEIVLDGKKHKPPLKHGRSKLSAMLLSHCLRGTRNYVSNFGGGTFNRNQRV